VVVAIGHVSFVTDLAQSIAPPWREAGEYFFLLVVFGLLALLAGLSWFGILTLRQPIMRRGRWLPLITAVFGAVGFLGFSGPEITAPFLLLRSLFALGLVGLGVALWLEEPADHTLVAQIPGV
jgi:hypothetical protein